MAVSFTIAHKSVVTGTGVSFTDTTSNVSTTITTPSSDFTWVPFNIYNTPTGVTHDFSVLTLVPSALLLGKTVYCDAASGSDSADGLTPATAKQSFGNAKGVSGRNRILFRPGVYDNTGSTVGADCALIGCNLGWTEATTENSGVFIRCQDMATGWSWVASGTAYFTKLKHASSTVWDKAFLDSKGFATLYSSGATIAAVQAASGLYNIDGLYLYIHRPGEIAPDNNVIVSSPLVDSVVMTAASYYIKGLTFEGGRNAATWNASNLSCWYAKNVGYRYTNGDGFTASAFGTIAHQNCTAKMCGYPTGQDGMGYSNSSSGVANAIEVDCICTYNGAPSGNNGNGSTIHNSNIRIVRVGGTYTYNHGPNIGDAGTTGTTNKSWIVGCTTGNSQAIQAGSNAGIVVQGDAANQLEAWVEEHTDTTDSYGIGGNSILHTRDNNITGSIITNTSYASGDFWQWSFGDGGTSTLRNPTHVFSTAGTYPVTLIASTGSGTGTSTSNVIIYPTTNFTEKMKWRATYRPGTYDTTDASFIKVVYGEIDVTT